MTVHVVRRIFVGGSGESLLMPLLGFGTPELAKEFAARDAQMLSALKTARTVLPNGVEEPFFKTVGMLGIRNVGQDIIEIEVKDSNLVVAQPKIVLAK